MNQIKEEVFEIIEKNLTFKHKILNLYLFGSRINGCSNEDSDYDFICVVSSDTNALGIYTITHKNYNINVYHFRYYKTLIYQNTVWMLQTLFLPKEFIFKEELKLEFQLRKLELLRNLQLDLDHHLLKAKRIWKENIKIGKKNFFHGIIWALFAKQLIEKSKIYDFQVGVVYWKEIFEMKSDRYNDFFEKYKPIYDSFLKEFRKLLAPLEYKIGNGLNTIDFIKQYSLEDLNRELSIFISKNDDGRYLLYSDDLLSPPEHPITNECSNGMVIDKELNVYCYPARKIYPFNEHKERDLEYCKLSDPPIDKMNWDNVSLYEIKSDNTRMCSLYYYKEKWVISSSRRIEADDQIIKSYLDEKNYFYHFDIEVHYNPWKFFSDELRAEVGFEVDEYGSSEKEIDTIFKNFSEYFWYLWKINDYKYPKETKYSYHFLVSCHNLITKKTCTNLKNDFIKLLSIRDLETLKDIDLKKFKNEFNWDSVLNDELKVKKIDFEKTKEEARKLDIKKGIGILIIDMNMNSSIVYSPLYHSFKRLLWCHEDDSKCEKYALDIVRYGLNDHIFSILSKWRFLLEKQEKIFEIFLKSISDIYDPLKFLCKKEFSEKISKQKKSMKNILFELKDNQAENVKEYIQKLSFFQFMKWMGK